MTAGKPDETFAAIRAMLEACKRDTFHVRTTDTSYEIRHEIHAQWEYMVPFAHLEWKRGRTKLTFYPLVSYYAVRDQVTPALAKHRMSQYTMFSFERKPSAAALAALQKMIELGHRVWYIETADR